MFRTILVPLDGSPLGESALPYAVTLARAAHARLVLLHAAGDALARSEADAALTRAAGDLWERGVAVETHVRLGRPEALIPQAAAKWRADLIAMSTHGRSGLGRWLYGSVADHVLRNPSVPVLLVPAACECVWPAAPGGTDAATLSDPPALVLLLDGSTFAEAAIGPARDLAAAFAARPHLVRTAPLPPTPFIYGEAPPGPAAMPGPAPMAAAWPDTGPHHRGTGDGYAWDIGLGEAMPWCGAIEDTGELERASAYLDGVAERLKADGTIVETHAAFDGPASAAATLAQRHNALAIALSTHGRSGIARLALGSVATKILRHSTVPLLLLGPLAVAQQPAWDARQLAELPATVSAPQHVA